MAYTDYAFDNTGENAANKVINELHSVNRAADVSVWPLQGAFFALNGTLDIEGRAGAGPWQEMLPNRDFMFSPNFLEPSARTGKTISSYIIIIKEVTEVRFKSYQAIGAIQNESLIAEVALSSIKRYEPFQWQMIGGDAQSFNPVFRDPELKGMSLEEIVANRLELIYQAIALPNSGTTFTAGDFTKIQAELAKKADSSSIGDGYKKPQATIPASKPDIMVIPLELSTDTVAGKLLIIFTTDDQRVHSREINFIYEANVPNQTLVEDLYANTPLFTNTLDKVGSAIQLQCIPVAPGEFQVFILAEATSLS